MRSPTLRKYAQKRRMGRVGSKGLAVRYSLREWGGI